MLGEMVVCATVSPHLSIPSYSVQCYLPLQQLHSASRVQAKRREEVLDPHSPIRDHEQGGGIGLRKLDFFCFKLLLNSSATDIVLVTLPCTSVETAIA